MNELKLSSNKSKFSICFRNFVDDIGSIFENKFRFHEFLNKFPKVAKLIHSIDIGDDGYKFYLNLMKEKPLEIMEDEFMILFTILIYMEGISLEFEEEKSRKIFQKLLDIFLSQDVVQKVGSMKPIIGIIARVLEDSNLFGTVFELFERRTKTTSSYIKKMEIMDDNRSILFYYFRTYKLYSNVTLASWKVENQQLFSQAKSTEEFANRWPKVEKYCKLELKKFYS